ncbi:MAG: V-type ATP synthase subunit I [Clostridia bacterium]|nr:V-type ATP synthase subunit I [Clostridia bacterium]
MALLPFKKLTLIAHSRDEEAILTLLSRSGSAEIVRTSEIEHLTRGDASARVEEVASELAEISFCLDFWRAEKVKLEKVLKRQKKEGTTLTSYSPEKVPLLEKIRGAKPEIAFDEFDRIGADHEDLRRVETRLREISAKETELKGEASRLTSLAEQLSYYKKCDLAFDAFNAGRYLETVIGLVPADQLAAADFTDLTLYMEEIDNRQRVATLFVAYPVVEREAVLERLSAVGFSRCAFDFPMTAAEKIAEITARKEEIAREEIALAEEAVSFEKEYEEKFRILHDYYRVEREKAAAIDSTFRTSTSFVLTAWVPAHLAEATEQALTDSGVTYYSIYEDPAEDEKYPTLARNNAVVTPYEGITNMYSAPDPREIDPNPFVAFFYFLFFGMMVSDAAYGILLALAGFGLYALKKPKKGEGHLLLIIGMGGISTLIWGVMFGGYFGEELIAPVLFSPMNEPLKMLILSVALGFFQILFGMGISFVSKCKKGQPLSAVFGEGSWFILFIGLGLFVASGMVDGFAVVKLPALIVLGLGLAGVLVGGALGKKGVKGKVLGALGNVYGVTGYMSDILSYCRLFGLGLATGVVGMVVNLIAGILRDLIPIVGYLLYVVILVVGHVFNIAINTLGAYVHDSRLQYVEFFSRFYTGGGHIFKPMGSDLKYIHLNSKGGKDL